MQNQIESQKQVSSQLSEPTLLNKSLPAKGKSRSTEVSVDEALEQVNTHLQKKSHTNIFRKTVSILLVLIIFSLVLLFLLLQSEGSIQIESKSNQVAEEFDFVELHTPSKFDAKILEIELDEVDAISILAFNPVTYQIYTSENTEEQRKIASITKLMTALIASEIYEKDTVLTMEGEFPYEIDGGINLEVGDSLTFDDALEAMLIGSKNDVAMVVAQNHPDGYEAFLEEMNKKAILLGMTNTSFSNPMGYDDINNYSTAEDLKKLSLYVLKNPNILEIVKMPSTNIDVINKEGEVINIKILTTNQLLGSSQYMQGLKTGYTKGAGPSFIGYFNAGESDQMITIILGADEDRFDETVELLYQINEAYE